MNVPVSRREVLAADDHEKTKDAPPQSPRGPHPHVSQEIGPRTEGAIYENIDGAFKVLELVTDHAKARELLHRRSAQFAVVVRDLRREDGQPFAVGSVWTTSDRLLKAGADDACVLCGYWRCRCGGSVTTVAPARLEGAR
jgi:hypothetical protein